MHAQTDSLTQNLDEYLMAANKFYKCIGSALVAQHGKILLQKAYGCKTFQKYLNDTNGIFQIGSVTEDEAGTESLIRFRIQFENVYRKAILQLKLLMVEDKLQKKVK